LIEPAAVLRSASFRHVHVGMNLDVRDATVSEIEGQPKQRAHQSQVAHGDRHVILSGSEIQIARAQASRLLKHSSDDLVRCLRSDIRRRSIGGDSAHTPPFRAIPRAAVRSDAM
jgi:hypothetical protein